MNKSVQSGAHICATSGRPVGIDIRSTPRTSIVLTRYLEMFQDLRLKFLSKLSKIQTKYAGGILSMNGLSCRIGVVSRVVSLVSLSDQTVWGMVSVLNYSYNKHFQCQGDKLALTLTNVKIKQTKCHVHVPAPFMGY